MHSESMEPYVRRGDILFLAMDQERIRAGDICVYKLAGREIPIVHRVITAHDEYVIIIFCCLYCVLWFSFADTR